MNLRKLCCVAPPIASHIPETITTIILMINMVSLYNMPASRAASRFI
jgi:hypothetical protein